MKMPLTSINSGNLEVHANDIFVLTIQIVNICLVGTRESWVLVDAGMPDSGDKIMNVVEDLFGSGSRPTAIVLTHGHFDHVGALKHLLSNWEVPVYAHPDEIPFLSGISDYPPGDATVDGGLVSELSPLFPNQGINLGQHIHALPKDGSIPGMEGWRWLHTPGHTPGHVSLFREHDRILIVGDAFVTVKQESIYKVMLQIQEISGPPKYFTTDWQSAWDSLKKLKALKPKLAITGHGEPMGHEWLITSLETLASNFEEMAIPEHGEYVPPDS